MRIDPKLPSVTSIEPRDAKAATRTAPAGTAASSVVTLSSAGAAVSAAPAQADMTAKVAHIRRQLASGTYPVDLDRLASRIVDDDVLREGGKS